MSCTAEQSTAESCVDGGGDCSCFPDGFEPFVKAVDGAFKKTQAFVMTTDPNFCQAASDSVCGEVSTNYACCCTEEVMAYTQCMFDQNLTVAFGLVECTSTCGEDEEDTSDDGGIPMLYIIIGVVAFVLLCCCCCCCGCYYYRRVRRRNKTEVKVDVNVSAETSNKEHTNKTENNSFNNVDAVERGAMVPIGGAVPPPGMMAGARGYDDFGYAQAYGASPYFGETRCSSRKHHKTDDFENDFVERAFRRLGGPTRSRSTRKSIRDKALDDYYDDDDYETDFESYRKQKSLKSSKKRASQRSLSDHDDDSNGTDSDAGRLSRTNTKSKGKSKRKLQSEKRKSQSKEESIRQARSILKDYNKSESLDADTCTRMDAEMTKLVAELKLQRQEMELKLKASEEEANKLKLERSISNSRLMELEAGRREKDKQLANVELDLVKKEKDEMARMIRKLEEAKAALEKKLSKAAEESDTLKQEKQVTVNKVSQMEEENDKLQEKLTALELSRDDIHRRLMEADRRSIQLKAEKKATTQEIQQFKIVGTTSMVENSERQRRTISKSIKRLEEERAQMRSMLAKMEHIDEGREDVTPRQLGNMILYCNDSNPLDDVSTINDALTVATTNDSSAEKERPAGWLGEHIANRSFQNIIEQDVYNNRSRGSLRGLSSHSSSDRSKSRDPIASTGPSFAVSSKRDKVRNAERRLQDHMIRSRSSRRSIDCDGSTASLDLVDEFYQ